MQVASYFSICKGIACVPSKITYSSEKGAGAWELRPACAPLRALVATGRGLPGTMIESYPGDGAPRAPSQRTTVSMFPAATRASSKWPLPAAKECAREA
eukprot:scaffold160410_cov26-Tisochrysis_lutea.AAC.2